MHSFVWCDHHVHHRNELTNFWFHGQVEFEIRHCSWLSDATRIPPQGDETVRHPPDILVLGHDGVFEFCYHDA